MNITATELDALHEATKRLETRWELPMPSPGTSTFDDFHVWDPLPWAAFLGGIRIAGVAIEGRRFLDIGCGIGTKLAYMHYLGWQTAGIDHWPHYAAAASGMCPFSMIEQVDLFDVDYFDADLVYMHRPGRSDATQDAVERHVVDRMPAGSLLFSACRAPSAELPLVHVDGEVWRRV